MNTLHKGDEEEEEEEEEDDDDDNNNNNNNVTFKKYGPHQMEDEMDVICSTQRKMKMYGKMQQKNLK